MEDSKKRAMETNKFSCDKCGEIFDSVSKNIYHIIILFKRLYGFDHERPTNIRINLILGFETEWAYGYSLTI